MPETIDAPVAVIPGVEPTIPAGSQPSGAPVDTTGRQAIIDRYQTMYGEPPAATPPPPAPEPVAVDPPAPASPDLAAVVQSLVAEINDLKSRANQPVVAPPPVSPAEEQDWLKYLAEGKKSEGERLLADVVGKQIGERLQQQAVEKTLALIEAQQFADKVRRDNADLMPMEQYITAAAAQRIEAATKAGKIKTPADYVTVYKDAINTELAAARQLVLTYRGEGRQDGASRVTAVLATPNLQPSTVNTERATTPQSNEPEPMTTSDYLAMRQANKARGQGMQFGQ